MDKPNGFMNLYKYKYIHKIYIYIYGNGSRLLLLEIENHQPLSNDMTQKCKPEGKSLNLSPNTIYVLFMY